VRPLSRPLCAFAMQAKVRQGVGAGENASEGQGARHGCGGRGAWTAGLVQGRALTRIGARAGRGRLAARAGGDVASAIGHAMGHLHDVGTAGVDGVR
jgi:hypothetical protein